MASTFAYSTQPFFSDSSTAIETMNLKLSQVTGRMKVLDRICANLTRYVQGLERGTVRWPDIHLLAQHMLVVDHKDHRQYSMDQNAPMGSIGRLLATKQAIDMQVYPAWVIQVGPAVALSFYNHQSLLHRKLDPALINEIADADRAGQTAINKYREQSLLPLQKQDADFMVFYENRIVGIHKAVATAMANDPMLVMDPHQPLRFWFRIRVAAFYNPPDFVEGLDFKDRYIMAQRLIAERLRSLKHMATKHESWIAKHIEAARATVLRMKSPDGIKVPGMILSKGPGSEPTTESVIITSVAMWMHTPRGLRGTGSIHTQAYGELVRILSEERQSRPSVDDMWRGPAVHRPLPPTIALARHEDNFGLGNLTELCKTTSGLAMQRLQQVEEVVNLRQQLMTARVQELEAESRERFCQELEEADRHGAKQEQPIELSKQLAVDGSQKVLSHIIDEINSDGQLGDDCRWFWRMMEALADPDQPFDAQGLDYLDSPDMMEGLGVNVQRRLTGYVQRRKEFGDILGKLFDGSITTVEGLGQMALLFQSARIVVDQRRADIPFCRAGRGLWMLRMMVAALDPTLSAVPSAFGRVASQSPSPFGRGLIGPAPAGVPTVFGGLASQIPSPFLSAMRNPESRPAPDTAGNLSLESTSPAVLVTAPAPAALSPDVPLVASSSSDRASPVATNTTLTTALNSASVRKASPSPPDYSAYVGMSPGSDQDLPTESSRVRCRGGYSVQHRGFPRGQHRGQHPGSRGYGRGAGFL
jgi:hypothetical protein